MPTEKLYGGVEAGGTKFRCAISDVDLRLVASATITTRTPDETLADVLAFFRLHLGAPPLALGIASYFFNACVGAEAEADLWRSVSEDATLIDRRQQDLTESFTTMAQLLAEIPQLKSAVATGHVGTVEPIAKRYLEPFNVELYLVTGRSGTVLAASDPDVATLSAARVAPDSVERFSTLTTHRRGLLQVISVPMMIAPESSVPELLGRLSIGFFVDDAVASRLRDLTGSEVAFVVALEQKAALVGTHVRLEREHTGDGFSAVRRWVIGERVLPKEDVRPRCEESRT